MRCMANVGATARDLASYDVAEFNRYVDTTYPVGAYGSPQDVLNNDVYGSISRGGQLASSYLNNLFTAVLPPK